MHEGGLAGGMRSPLRHRKAPEPDFLDVDAARSDPSATLENVGPERRPPLDDEEMDVYSGTTSGSGLRGKPERGSIGDLR